MPACFSEQGGSHRRGGASAPQIAGEITMKYETKKRIGGTREIVDVDAFAASLEVSAEAASPLLTNRHQDYRMTRRSILIGAAASLICTPAIVRAASLMPVRGLPLQFLSPLGEFYRRNFYHSLDFDLRTGRSMSMVVENGKIISVADARRMVALARAQGWLPPYSPKI
jgi:hypothetical protein